MSTRPTGSKDLTNLWASSGTIVVPSSAKQLAGWKTGERPPAQYKNWWANRVDSWLKYFADGDVSLNNVLVGGTLGVTGTVTVAGFAASGNATIGGTLGVTGVATLSNNATVGGTLGVTGATTLTGGATVGANQHVTVSGTGSYKHGIVTLNVPVIGPSQVAAGAITFASTAQFTTGNSVLIPFTLPTSKRVRGVRVNLTDAVGTTYRVRLYFSDRFLFANPALVATGATSAGSGANQNIAITGITQPVGEGATFFVSVENVAGAGSTGVYACAVDYDEV